MFYVFWYLGMTVIVECPALKFTYIYYIEEKNINSLDNLENLKVLIRTVENSENLKCTKKI